MSTNKYSWYVLGLTHADFKRKKKPHKLLTPLMSDLYNAIFTPWKLQELGIAGSLHGKSALSIDKGCKNYGENPWWFPVPVVFMG